MPDRIPGEIVALTNAVDTDGSFRLAALIATPGGPQVGVLVAPRNGTAGQLGFEPVPRLAEGMVGTVEYESLKVERAAVPAGPDPNDPRGIRSTSRRAGMVG
jgi:hypothetical protein